MDILGGVVVGDFVEEGERETLPEVYYFPIWAEGEDGGIFNDVVGFAKIVIFVGVYDFDFVAGVAIKIFEPGVDIAGIVAAFFGDTDYSHFLAFCSFRIFSKSSRVLNSRKTLAKRT